MTFDISLEAIEADFALAERSPGGTLERLALAKAHVRAILLAAQPPLRLVAPPMTDQDIKQLSEKYHPAPLMQIPETNTVPSMTEAQAHAAAEVAGTIIDESAEPEDDDVDDDFFAEAKKERGR